MYICMCVCMCVNRTRETYWFRSLREFKEKAFRTLDSRCFRRVMEFLACLCVSRARSAKGSGKVGAMHARA